MTQLREIMKVLPTGWGLFLRCRHLTYTATVKDVFGDERARGVASLPDAALTRVLTNLRGQ